MRNQQKVTTPPSYAGSDKRGHPVPQPSRSKRSAVGPGLRIQRRLKKSSKHVRTMMVSCAARTGGACLWSVCACGDRDRVCQSDDEERKGAHHIRPAADLLQRTARNLAGPHTPTRSRRVTLGHPLPVPPRRMVHDCEGSRSTSSGAGKDRGCGTRRADDHDALLPPSNDGT